MEYDVAIIGAGWAGINAALKARESGLSPILIERSLSGGTCLHRGCIPTKALIQSAKILSTLKRSSAFGIASQEAALDFNAVTQRKEKIVAQIHAGLKNSLQGIEYVNAEAQVISPREVKTPLGKVTARFLLIASGSRPLDPQALGLAAGNIITSDGMLDLRKIPSSLLIIGGGVIGCEFANLYASFGSTVAVAELTPRLLPGLDAEIAKKLETAFKKKGIRVLTGTDARTLDLTGYETVLFAVGRAADTAQLGIEALGVETRKNAVLTDEFMRTNVQGVFAAGDCTAKAMLAHAAAHQGRRAIENMALSKRQQPPIPCDNLVPSCVYTYPEIARVGLSEEEAQKKDIAVTVFKADFLASGMARIMDETTGFIKIIADPRTNELYGASIIGPGATELIGTLAVAIKARMRADELAETILPHPTLSEIITDALRQKSGL
ncbi:MAG: dihydrolipoyl dehydrogenase [Candidatus Omnitrophica bacterium]|nr:dihydrolipoyl dehydrogenase [Candidatus Omnitrophota bacterium]